MSRPIVYNWPIPDVQAVAVTQSLGGAGNLLLNGNLASGGSVVFPGFIRTVSLTSINDLSGINFTVTGSAAGFPVSETIAGPNATTVETTVIFDTVTTITADGAANGVSAGTGTIGQTQWCLYDYYRNAVTFVTMAITVTNNINYSFQATLDDVTQVQVPFALDVTGNMTNKTDNQFGFSQAPLQYYSLKINSSDAMGSLRATFLQQAVT